MQQLTFSDVEYKNRKRITKREEFLNSMNDIIPWAEWVDMIRPYYPDGKRGRPPKEIETMLRMYLMQNWFSLSDEGIEDAIYDVYSMRQFLGINFLTEQVPDATTLLHFRRLMEDNKLGKKLFDDVNSRLDKAGLIMHGGSIIDATIIAAPSSTKNRTGKRDPEMHQTKKGNQWYHGMKIHAGVDAGSGYAHTITATAANASDISEAHNLIREDDDICYADSGYTGIDKRPEIVGNSNLSSVEYRVAIKPSRLKTTKIFKGFNWERHIESRKASTRCKVEHPFLIVKNLFGYRKVVYKGLEKNLNRFHMLFASANLLMCIRSKRTNEFVMG